MRRLNVIVPILALTVSWLLISGMPRAAGTAVSHNPQRTDGDAVIFSLFKETDGSFYIEPIVIIADGKFTEPPAGQDEGVIKKFTESYFQAGRKYRVTFGGGDAGSLTVQKYEPDTCGNLLAEVAAQTTARLGGEVRALATSSGKIGSGESSRRAPTEAERASALEVARTVYGQRRVGPAFVRKMTTVNLTATDIERDGRFELIGAFQIDGTNDAKHNLFIIFEETAAGKYKAAWNWYQKGYEDRKLLDVIDLDGDGTAEVIATGFEIENNFYVIYKRQAGTWRPVYTGGGGGAC